MFYKIEAVEMKSLLKISSLLQPLENPSLLPFRPLIHRRWTSCFGGLLSSPPRRRGELSLLWSPRILLYSHRLLPWSHLLVPGVLSLPSKLLSLAVWGEGNSTPPRIGWNSAPLTPPARSTQLTSTSTKKRGALRGATRGWRSPSWE